MLQTRKSLAVWLEESFTVLAKQGAHDGQVIRLVEFGDYLGEEWVQNL